MNKKATMQPQELFDQKSECKKDVLGEAMGAIFYDPPKDRLCQKFKNGVVMGVRSANKLADLICIRGRIFDAYEKNAGWLGAPLADEYETINSEGVQIIVQRFESGVVWCPSDGSGDVSKLSWRDWHAVSRPDDNTASIPVAGASGRNMVYCIILGMIVGFVLGLFFQCF